MTNVLLTGFFILAALTLTVAGVGMIRISIDAHRLRRNMGATRSSQLLFAVLEILLVVSMFLSAVCAVLAAIHGT